MAAGKILRMTTEGAFPDGGIGIWKIGLRNPFRAQWDLATDRYLIAEVGGNNQATAWEDLHVMRLNSTVYNLGWPFCEGRPCDRNPNFPLCRCGVHDEPLYTYPHLNRNAGMIGSEICRSLNFPASYYNAYFFSDYPRKQIRYIRFDASGQGFGDTVFMSGLSKTNLLRFAPDGTLYYSYLTGDLYRVTYKGKLPPFGFNSSDTTTSTTTTPSPTAKITASTVSKTTGGGRGMGWRLQL